MCDATCSLRRITSGLSGFCLGLGPFHTFDSDQFVTCAVHRFPSQLSLSEPGSRKLSLGSLKPTPYGPYPSGPYPSSCQRKQHHKCAAKIAKTLDLDDCGRIPCSGSRGIKFLHTGRREADWGTEKCKYIYILYHKMPRKYASIFHFHVCFQLLAFQKAGLGGLCLLFSDLRGFLVSERSINKIKSVQKKLGS